MLALALGLTISWSLAADELTPQKSEDIVRLYEMSGGSVVARQLTAASVQGVVASIKARRPDVDQRVLDVVERETTSFFNEKFTAAGGFYDLLVPIYHKHFSHEDILAITAFYRTPVGQRAVAALPQIAQESVVAGQGWMTRMQPEFNARLQQAFTREGIEFR